MAPTPVAWHSVSAPHLFWDNNCVHTVLRANKLIPTREFFDDFDGLISWKYKISSYDTTHVPHFITKAFIT